MGLFNQLMSYLAGVAGLADPNVPASPPPTAKPAKSVLDPKRLFFDTFSIFAVQCMAETGIPASVTLAQAALESNWGKAAPGNNFFGVKAGKGYKGATQSLMTTEVIKGKSARVRALFRRYASPADSFIDHGNVIMTSRYLNHAMAHTESARAFIVALQSKAAKYATDPDYVEKIMRIIHDFDLEKFDKTP